MPAGMPLSTPVPAPTPAPELESVAAPLMLPAATSEKSITAEELHTAFQSNMRALLRDGLCSDVTLQVGHPGLLPIPHLDCAPTAERNQPHAHAHTRSFQLLQNMHDADNSDSSCRLAVMLRWRCKTSH